MQIKYNTILIFLLSSIFGLLLGYRYKDTIQSEIILPIKSLKKDSTLTQYKKLTCPENNLHIAYFGQSNSSNYVFPKATHKIPENLYQFDWKTGACYQYQEPLLGADGKGGSTITYAVIELAEKTKKPIIVTSFGRGSSTIHQWSQGYLSFKHELVLKSLVKAGLSPQIFLWHQGESDRKVNNHSIENFRALDYFKLPLPSNFRLGTSKEFYKSSLNEVINKTRDYFPNSYFGIALASRCFYDSPWEPVRSAQKEVASLGGKNNFLTTDTDLLIDGDLRYDRCHFSDRGAIKIGELYIKSLNPILTQLDINLD